MIIDWTPEPFLSQDPRDLGVYLQRQLQGMAAAFNGEMIRLNGTSVAPDKVQEGDIRRAVSGGWDPGAGVGYYEYRSGAWQKL